MIKPLWSSSLPNETNKDHDSFITDKEQIYSDEKDPVIVQCVFTVFKLCFS